MFQVSGFVDGGGCAATTPPRVEMGVRQTIERCHFGGPVVVSFPASAHPIPELHRPSKVGRNTVTSGGPFTVAVTELSFTGPRRAYSLCAWPAATSGGPDTVPGNEPLLPFQKTNYAQPCVPDLLWERAASAEKGTRLTCDLRRR
jgi:hypothetical protein